MPKGFDSPPRRKRDRDIPAPPDVKAQYINNRAHMNPELMETKVLWEAPSMLYKKYNRDGLGLRGILQSFKYETYDTGTVGIYSALEVAQIKKVIIALESKVFSTGKELVELVRQLTKGTSELVQNNLMGLATEFAAEEVSRTVSSSSSFESEMFRF
jgi:hypothetical protein